MEPAVASHASSARAGEQEIFAEALRARRELVYSYLDNWPGAAAFRPIEIRDALFSYIRRRGKALRPILLLLSCAAVGGDESVALPAAAAVEVFQTWTLVHDDIIDRDDTRRGKPTVHAEYRERAKDKLRLDSASAIHYGLTVGLLAGDLQQSWCYALLSDLTERGVSANLVLDLVRRMATYLTPQLLEGEMLDVQFALPSAPMPSEDDVLDMLGKKTAALLEYAAWAGARIGLGDQVNSNGYAEALGKFARLCGTAFQLQDDVLGLTADQDILGKPIGSDLREGKLTYLISRGIASSDDSQLVVLRGVLGNPLASRSDVRKATEILHGTGAINASEELANSYIDQGLKELDKLPPSVARNLLADWAIYLLARKY